MVSVSKAGRPGAGTPRAALDTCQSVLGGIVGTIIPLFTPQEQACSEFAALRRIPRLVRGTPGCGGLVRVFPGDLTWWHYRGAIDAFGVQEKFDAGHEPAVEWYLAEEVPEE